MNTLKTAPQHWAPTTRKDHALVREELELLIASPQFCSSKRYPALLRYVVERTLAGEGSLLKERTLGIEVFERSPDYDTSSDPVVRYTAGEVRKRLIAAYHEREDAEVQIALPAGSYAAEFLRCPLPEAIDAELPFSATAIESVTAELAPLSLAAPDLVTKKVAKPIRAAKPAVQGRVLAIVTGAVLILLVAATLLFKRSAETSLSAFWAPVFHERGQTVLCVGGVTFAENNFSGTHTAGKDTAYPFASMQIVSSVSQISGLLERGGAKYEVQAAASTRLPELEEHPVVLIGGYNNEWTLRLLKPLRFHFSDEPVESIIDTQHPEKSWQRDRAQPYASADDYALIARFHDSLTGSVVVAAAGLGRNGTEMASRLLTSERYMDLVYKKLGHNLSLSNVEILLHSRVVDGKTGAPQIEEIYTW